MLGFGFELFILEDFLLRFVDVVHVIDLFFSRPLYRSHMNRINQVRSYITVYRSRG